MRFGHDNFPAKFSCFGQELWDKNRPKDVRNTMASTMAAAHIGTLDAEVRARRLWYHDIELADGVRTRFLEDYAANPVLERVDASCTRIEVQLDAYLSGAARLGSVLDAGCADGRFIAWAARRGAEHIVGIERNKHNHDRTAFVCDALGLENASLRWGSIESNLGTESFDTVLCLGLIYHLVNPLGTLHLLRRVCKGRLFLTAAVDLEDGDGSPASRLDLYAEGAHGLWSFNLPMIRKLLTTAGFCIVDEIASSPIGGGRHVIVHAEAGAFETHHVFADRIDQEFPINVDTRRDRVCFEWRRLSDMINKPVAIFGAGTHTQWLLDCVKKMQGSHQAIQVEAILDDRAAPGQVIHGLPVIKPMEMDRDRIGAVAISSWHQSNVLRQRATAIFGADMPLICFD